METRWGTLIGLLNPLLSPGSPAPSRPAVSAAGDRIAMIYGNALVAALQIGALTAVVLMVKMSPDSVNALLEQIGLGSSPPGVSTSARRPATALMFGLLALVLLLFVLDPEVRVLLLLIDAIGIDILLVFLSLQMRSYLAVLQIWVTAPLRWRRARARASIGK